MSLTLFRNSRVVVAEDPQLTNVASQMLVESAKDSSSHEETSCGVQKLSPSAADVALPMGGVTNGKYLLIHTDGEINVALEAAPNDKINVLPPSPIIKGVLEITGGFTAVFVNNPSTSVTPLVSYTILGD